MTQEEMKNVGLPYSQVLVRGVGIWAMAAGLGGDEECGAGPTATGLWGSEACVLE